MEKSVNRVLQAWKSWDERHAEIGRAIESNKDDQRIIQRLKLAHFQKCEALLAAGIRDEERALLPLLTTAIAKLEKQVYPNWAQRWFFRLKNFVYGRPAYVREVQKNRQDNLDNLKQQLKRSGLSDFSGKLGSCLNIDQHRHTIPLNSQLDPLRSLHITLQFEKDALNNFHLTTIEGSLKHQNSAQPAQSYKFKTEEWPGLTIQQVKNLLEGRAIRQYYVDMGGEPRSQWLELAAGGTVKKYMESYGYNLNKLVDDLPAQRMMQAGGKATVLERLEQGYTVPILWAHKVPRKWCICRLIPSTHQ